MYVLILLPKIAVKLVCYTHHRYDLLVDVRENYFAIFLVTDRHLSINPTVQENSLIRYIS